MENYEFTAEIGNDTGDVTSIHLNENMSVHAMMEHAVHEMYPHTTVPLIQYGITVDGKSYPEGAWQGQTVRDLGITAESELLIYPPAPKGQR